MVTDDRIDRAYRQWAFDPIIRILKERLEENTLDGKQKFDYDLAVEGNSRAREDEVILALIKKAIGGKL